MEGNCKDMSILGGITDTIGTLIADNTSIKEVMQGLAAQDRGDRPFAVITYGTDIVSSEGMDGTVDSHIATTITIFGDDWEEVQTGIEELMILFMGTTVSNQLTNAHPTNVIELNMTGYTPAMMAEGDIASLSKFVGIVAFDLFLRYNY